MNIDFIKWMAEKADGYMVMDGRIYYEGCYFNNPEHLWEHKLHKANLLQRAIEGVNRDKRQVIVQLSDCIQVINGATSYKVNHEDYTNIDQAKESALRYVKEQEDV